MASAARPSAPQAPGDMASGAPGAYNPCPRFARLPAPGDPTFPRDVRIESYDPELAQAIAH